MGGGASLFEWEGGDVWRIVRGGDAIPGGHCEAAALGGGLPERNGLELSRRLDLSGRSFRAMVQRIVGDRAGDEHDAAARRISRQRARMDKNFAVARISRAGSAGSGGFGALFHRLAGASEFRRVLEANFH